MEHSPTSATGTGWERTPWRATHRAAWQALMKADEWLDRVPRRRSARITGRTPLAIWLAPDLGYLRWVPYCSDVRQAQP